MDTNESETPETKTDTETEIVHGIEKDIYFKKPENKAKKLIRKYVYIFLSAFFYSVSFHYFVATCKFAPGGIGGIFAMVQYLLHSENAVSGVDYSQFVIIVLNVPVLIVAYKVLYKNFVINTAINILFMTLILFVLDNFIDPNYVFSITREPIVNDVGTRLVSALIAGALCGLSLACGLKVNSSTGGADVVGAMIQKKYPHKSVASMIFVVNAVIMAISFFVYQDNFMPIFLSIIYLTVSTKVCDAILQGAKTGLKFEVVTEHAEEISEEIIVKLGHGVTVTKAMGMFEHKNKSLLICIIQPRQIARFQSIISKYPDTFAYVGQVSEIIGKFNSTGEQNNGSKGQKK